MGKASLRLVRQIWVGLAVTLMVTMQSHGVSDARHRIEHAVQFPGVAYSDAAAGDHDHGDQTHGHVHDVEGDAASAEETQLDGGDARPASHHHHNTVELHAALTVPARASNSDALSAADLHAPAEAWPPGAQADGPLDPPRRRA